MVFDFNVQPFCATVIQQDGEKDRVIDEIVIKTNGTTERACAEFLARQCRDGDGKEHHFKDHEGGVIVTGDPGGLARNVQSSIAGFDNFATIKSCLGHMRGFLSRPPGQVPIINSINLTNARLRNSTQAGGQVRLLIDPRCRQTIRDFERVTTLNDGRIDKAKDPSLTHLTDGIRYYLWKFRRGMRYGRGI